MLWIVVDYDKSLLSLVGRIFETICIQESNVRICQPFGAKVMSCLSGDVTTIDVLVDAKRKCSQYNQYI
jgi:hypothetical protein